MRALTEWIPGNEELEITLSEEKILQSEDVIAKNVETGYGRESSKLSAQEAAAKIWWQWWRCRVLMNRLQMDSHRIEIAHFPLF